MTPIPQEWIRRYVDSLLESAKAFGPDTKMGQAALLRVDHLMDMVKAFRDDEKKKKKKKSHA